MSPIHIHEHLIMFKSPADIAKLPPPSIDLSVTDQERDYLSNYNSQGTGKFYYEEIKENHFKEEEILMRSQ